MTAPGTPAVGRAPRAAAAAPGPGRAGAPGRLPRGAPELRVPGGPWPAAAGALALLLLGLAAWLAWPRPAPAPPRPAVRAALLDASAGTTRLRPGWSLWARRALVAEAEEALRRGEELEVVRFGADVERLFGPGDPADFLAEHGGGRGAPPGLALAGAAAEGARLAAALELALPGLLEPGRRPGSLVLLGRRSYSGPDPRPLLARLGRAGAGVRLVEPPPPELPNLALAALDLPRSPAPGEPLAARATLELTAGEEPLAELLRAAEVRIELELRAPSGRRRLASVLPPPALDPGARAARWSSVLDLGPAEPGWTELTARARLLAPGALREGDPLPADDVRSATTRTGGVRVGLAVAPPARRAELEAWLGGDPWEGIAWVLLEPEGLAARLPGADLVLALDVPLAELSAPWLSDFVRRRGGGLLVCGGWGLLRQWTGGPGDAPLARLLPLAPAGDDDDPREVIFVVDGSGSMVGEPFEHVKAALIELVEVAPPRDRLSLRFFTAALHAPLELSGDTPAARRRALSRLLATRAPGGETAILYSLEQLVAARAGAEHPGLAVLLSDGLDHRAFDVPERAAAIRQGLAESRTRLAVVGVGERADLELLREVAGGEQELRFAHELSELAEIFQREVHRDRVREGPVAVRIPQLAGDVEGGFEVEVELELARAVLEALVRLPEGALPPLERHARAELVPGAAPLLASEHGEPVLAVQRVGAGAVAAFVSGPLEGWAPAWRGAHGALAPLARALADGPRAPEPELSLVAGRLELEGVPAAWPARVEARLLDDAGRVLSTHDLWLPPGRPGEDPRARRAAREPLVRDLVPRGLSPGSLVRVALGDGDRELASVPLALPPAAELQGERALGPFGPEGAPPGPAGTGAAPDPRHVPPLAAGLALLFLAGLGWVRQRRPAAGAGSVP